MLERTFKIINWMLSKNRISIFTSNITICIKIQIINSTKNRLCKTNIIVVLNLGITF